MCICQIYVTCCCLCPELPKVEIAPNVTSSTPTSMDLTWQAWTGYVAPALQVIYRIQYRRHSHYGNGTMWNSGPDAINPNVKKGYAEATLKGLQHNTFYMVCVLPLLWHQAKLYTGTCSPSAGPFRTKCASECSVIYYPLSSNNLLYYSDI